VLIDDCGDQEQAAEHAQRQPHHQLQVLEERQTDTAEVSVPRCHHQARGAQLQKMAGLGPGREHFVDG